MNKVTLELEGNYWTLYVDDKQYGCGYLEDQIDLVDEMVRKYLHSSVFDVDEFFGEER